MRKVIRDNKVAVVVTNKFGAGWHSWNPDLPEMLFHPYIIEWVENGKQGDIEEVVNNALVDCGYDPEEQFFCSLGAENLEIEWLPVGTQFYIKEYDGIEELITVKDFYLTA